MYVRKRLRGFGGKTTRIGVRFQEIEAGLPGVAPNTLSARLKVLETQGVIATRLYERHLPRYEYLLTAKGKSLGPVLKALGAWGSSYA
jgi:DNA-binding HxlR family transcriptional regulator